MDFLLLKTIAIVLNSTRLVPLHRSSYVGQMISCVTRWRRSLPRCLCVVKRVLESKSCESQVGVLSAALSIYLENYATSMVESTLKPVLVHKLLLWVFFLVCEAPPVFLRRAPGTARCAGLQSLLVIPNTLAVNAAQDSESSCKIKSFSWAQVNPGRKNLKW